MLRGKFAYGSAMLSLSIVAAAMYPGADGCTHNLATASGLAFLTLGAAVVGACDLRRSLQRNREQLSVR